MTKAEMLSFLEKKLNLSKIKPLIYFSYVEWKDNPNTIIEQVQEQFKNLNSIVRSSGIGEDGELSSMAGQFHSILDIDIMNTSLLIDSINTVFSSYGRKNDNHQVLIQPMITDVLLSGVVFTHDQKTGAPYTSIAYDDETGKTDTITSGKILSKCLRIWSGTKLDALSSKRMRKVYEAIKEIEFIKSETALDIEFALDHHYVVWILQVRPLIIENTMSVGEIKKLEKTLKNICTQVDSITIPQDNILGIRSLLSDMSDWNPAEMIGVNPQPLSYSLYQKLITQSVWNEARSGMGYLNMSGHHLMEKIAGHPFIDTRKSFNSFLPNQIDPLVGERLVNAWLHRIAEKPALYDKIEFDVVPTCYTPSFDKFFNSVYNNVLTSQQLEIYKNKLMVLTNDCVNGNIPYNIDWCEEQAKKLEVIQENYSLNQLFEGTLEEILCSIEETIEECQEYGTKPFSAAARHAFIAESILRSCIEVSAIDQDSAEILKTSFSTISHTIIESMAEIKQSHEQKSYFFKKFGHIRPSSYDILSPRYDNMKGLEKLSVTTPQSKRKKDHDPILINGLRRIFSECGYTFTAEDFINYYIKSIQMREYIKLIFTRGLSDILECTAFIGQYYKLDRQDVSFIPIDNLISAVRQKKSADVLKVIVKRNKEEQEAYKYVHTNYLINNSRDIYVVPVQRSIPNFITYKRVLADAIMIAENESARSDLEGKIVCIERADPGFDWIFGCNIAGLITKYGGANSHMAIRCSEFSLPAAIGCGDLIYKKLCSATRIEMDCRAEKIECM